MKLLVDNSFTTIIDFTPTEYKVVEAVLTYVDETKEKEKKALHMSLQKAMRMRYLRKVAYLSAKLQEYGDCTVCLLNTNNTFPTGLLFKVTQALNKGLENDKYIGRILPYAIEDIRARPQSFQTYRWYNQPPKSRYYQEDCIKLGTERARGTFECAVGSGKTLIAANLIKEAGVNCLFVVPSIALIEQTKHVLGLYFGKEKVQQVTTANVKSHKKLKPIRISTVQTLASLQKQDMLGLVVEDIDMLIIDEAHHGAANSYTNLLKAFNHIYYRFNFSGTYTRNDSKIMELWGVCGEKLYKYSAAQAISDGFLTPLTFKIKRVNGFQGNVYHEEYTDNYGSKAFLDAIVEEVRTIPDGKQILILVDRKEAVGRQISDWLTIKNIESVYMTGDDNKHDVTKAIEDFNDKKCRILIASQILGEGVDIRSTDVLIMARGGKSDIAITQAVGRAVRLYPGKVSAQIIDFCFTNTKWLEKHTNMRIENYVEEFAGKITWA